MTKRILDRVQLILISTIIVHISVVSVFSMGKSEGSTDDTPGPYEVGDLVVYGTAGTSIKHCGHSAMFYYQQLDGGTWKDAVIDSMPAGGVTANFNVGSHGSTEGVFTTAALADGTWSAFKQTGRMTLVANAMTYIGSVYDKTTPINASDVAWTVLTDNSLVINFYESADPAYLGTFVIQPDSIYATPPGAVDYKPYQSGGNPGAPRFTCSGFTERVYEDTGLDITPAAGTYTHSEIKWKILGVERA